MKPAKTWHVEYNSNNSGGSWWLDDDDWKALELKGWTIHWAKDDPYRNKFGGMMDGRWLGALAQSACIEVDTISKWHAEDAAKDYWARTLCKNPEEEGCETCGPPHYFWANEKENCWVHDPTNPKWTT